MTFEDDFFPLKPEVDPKMISVPYKEHTVDGSEIRNNQLGCIKPRKYWDKLPTSTG